MRNHANIKVNIYLHFMASKSLKNFTDVLNFTSISCKWFRLPLGKNGKNLRLITQKHTIKICIPNILQVFLHNVHEEFDLFVFLGLFKYSISTILILQTKVVCCPRQTGCCGTCDVTTPKHRNPDWSQTWTTDNWGQIIKSIWIPMHQYLSHLLTSNYNQLGLIVMFAICKIMNSLNLFFSTASRAHRFPSPFPLSQVPHHGVPANFLPDHEVSRQRNGRWERQPFRITPK